MFLGITLSKRSSKGRHHSCTSVVRWWISLDRTRSLGQCHWAYQPREDGLSDERRQSRSSLRVESVDKQEQATGESSTTFAVNRPAIRMEVWLCLPLWTSTSELTSIDDFSQSYSPSWFLRVKTPSSPNRTFQTRATSRPTVRDDQRHQSHCCSWGCRRPSSIEEWRGIFFF